MPETYTVNGQDVETYDKTALDDYRGKWSRDEEVTEVDMENHVVPQYAKHFPPVGEYPDEVYDNTGCLPVETVRDELRAGDTVLFWNGPPCNPNAYLVTGTVKRLPPVPYSPSIGEKETPSNDHFEITYGQFDHRPDSIFGEMLSTERVDCVVEINPEPSR